MTIVNRSEMPINRKMEIDLASIHGNIFFLFAVVKKLSKQLMLDADEIIQNMMKSTYEDAIKLFDSHFGNFVILYK